MGDGYFLAKPAGHFGFTPLICLVVVPFLQVMMIFFVDVFFFAVIGLLWTSLTRKVGLEKVKPDARKLIVFSLNLAETVAIFGFPLSLNTSTDALIAAPDNFHMQFAYSRFKTIE